MSSRIVKIGFAYSTNRANKALRATNCHGFSASVIGPPKVRNNCQTITRNKMAHAMYCITSKALDINGKYSSIAVISVPRALRNKPDTASINDEAIPEIHVMIPSNIQSKIATHLRSAID